MNACYSIILLHVLIFTWNNCYLFIIYCNDCCKLLMYKTNTKHAWRMASVSKWSFNVQFLLLKVVFYLIEDICFTADLHITITCMLYLFGIWSTLGYYEHGERSPNLFCCKIYSGLILCTNNEMYNYKEINYYYESMLVHFL